MALESRIIRGTVWAEQLRELLAKAPTEIDTWMEQQTRLLKSDNHSRVGLLPLGRELCYLKLYRGKSALQNLFFRLGYGRGVRAFDAARKLAAAGVAVPEPRGALQLPGGMLLLTEGIADSSDLISLWRQQPGDEKLQELMAGAGRALAGLHGAGFAHGDCKWSNLLISGERFFFVDLESVLKLRVGSPGIARDLARFTVNAEDMGLPGEYYELFLATYAIGVGRQRDALVREILKPLGRMRRKHLAKYGARGHRLI
jgi:tRNA A-37 threonylcarbamoyl transferase component Bud32